MIETRILEVGGAPGNTSIITAIDRLMMGRMEPSARIQGIDGKRLRIGGEKLFVMGDGIVGLLIGLPRFGVDAFAHSLMPDLAAIAGMVDAPLNLLFSSLLRTVQ